MCLCGRHSKRHRGRPSGSTNHPRGPNRPLPAEALAQKFWRQARLVTKCSCLHRRPPFLDRTKPQRKAHRALRLNPPAKCRGYFLRKNQPIKAPRNPPKSTIRGVTTNGTNKNALNVLSDGHLNSLIVMLSIIRRNTEPQIALQAAYSNSPKFGFSFPSYLAQRKPYTMANPPRTIRK